MSTSSNITESLQKEGLAMIEFSRLNSTFKDVLSVYLAPCLARYMQELKKLPDTRMPPKSALYIFDKNRYKDFLQMAVIEDWEGFVKKSKRTEHHYTTKYDIIYSGAYIDITKLPRYVDEEGRQEFDNITESPYTAYDKGVYHLVRIETQIETLKKKSLLTELLLYIPTPLKRS